MVGTVCRKYVQVAHLQRRFSHLLLQGYNLLVTSAPQQATFQTFLPNMCNIYLERA